MGQVLPSNIVFKFDGAQLLLHPMGRTAAHPSLAKSDISTTELLLRFLGRISGMCSGAEARMSAGNYQKTVATNSVLLQSLF